MALRIPVSRTAALFTLMGLNVVMIVCTIFQLELGSYDSQMTVVTEEVGSKDSLVLMQRLVQSRLAVRPAANVSALHPVAGMRVPSAGEPTGAATSLLALTRTRLRGAFNNKFNSTLADSGSDSYSQRVGIQLLFGVLYYFLIVSRYPLLERKEDDTPPPNAAALQQKNEISAVCDVSWSNIFHSFCCTGPRAAQTFHSTGVLNYWPSCILMSSFPCCVLWAANSFTNLNKKLGGEQDGCVYGGACAMCCSCCMIAKDAQTLDLLTGATTELCSVTPSPEIMKAGGRRGRDGGGCRCA
jgi:hypothetical protein